MSWESFKRWFTGFDELSFWWIQICIGSPMRRSSYPSSSAQFMEEEGKVSDQDTAMPEQELDQQVLEFESSASSQHDNPLASLRTQPTGKVPVKLPSDECLCRKMEKFNITLIEGYSTCGSDTLTKLSAIFQDLEHLNDIQKISYGGHFIFKIRLQFCTDMCL